jgi:hypothetical protein
MKAGEIIVGAALLVAVGAVAMYAIKKGHLSPGGTAPSNVPTPANNPPVYNPAPMQTSQGIPGKPKIDVKAIADLISSVSSAIGNIGSK